jgi:hypothetical protein
LLAAVDGYAMCLVSRAQGVPRLLGSIELPAALLMTLTNGLRWLSVIKAGFEITLPD